MAWQEDLELDIAEQLSKYYEPPAVDDFGLTNDLDDVRLVVFAAENWGWTVEETLNQPVTWLDDMIRYTNLRERIRWENKEAGATPYEEQNTPGKVIRFG